MKVNRNYVDTAVFVALPRISRRKLWRCAKHMASKASVGAGAVSFGAVVVQKADEVS